MREILFRGKRVDNGEWAFGCLIQCAITGKQYIFPAGSDANESEKVGEDGCLKLVTFEVIPETVGQYTGKMRVDGTKLFKGDVFWDADYEQEFTVEWSDEVLAWLATDDSSGSEFLSDIWNDSCTILRSIHDNPELLEGATK